MLDFAAGKYALFVWPAYGLSAALLGAMILDSLARARRWKQEVKRREAEAGHEEPQA